MVSPSEIFMGFCRYYNSLALEYGESLSTHTERLLSYFDMLGRMLGYRIYSEYTIKKLARMGFSFPLDLGGKKMDMIWWQWADKDKDSIEFALESQQSSGMDEITKDIRKLLVVPAKLRVLYCASEDHNKIVEQIKKELQSQKEERESSFLAIVDPWVGPDKFSEGTLRGILLDEKGYVRGQGTAQVDEMHDGPHLIRVFLNAEWQETT